MFGLVAHCGRKTASNVVIMITSAAYLPRVVGSCVPLSKDRQPQPFQGFQEEFAYSRLAVSLVTCQFTPNDATGHGLNRCGCSFTSGGTNRELRPSL